MSITVNGLKNQTKNKLRRGAIKPLAARTAALLLAVLFAFACGCHGRPMPIDPAAAEPTPTPSPEPVPADGGVLHLAMPENASHDDPLMVNTEEMLYLFSLVYDKLITVNDSGELTPCLCESWSSEGAGVWTLRLRENAVWQDGSGKLKAQDVVDTYSALADMPESYYYWCTEHIVSMEATDTNTVTVKMDIPGLMALYSLAFPIRKSGVLVGTGAYRASRVEDDLIILAANDGWWDRSPYISTVIFEARDSNETALASYEAGQLNMVPTNLLTAGKYARKDETNVLDVMTQGMELLLFNNSIFSDANVRQAVARGINRSRIITNVYMNRARVCDVPIPSDNWLYDSRSAALNYDAVAALNYLKQAGYTATDPEGVRSNPGTGRKLELKLLTSATTDNTTRYDAASLIASQLRELGFDIEIVTAEHTLGDGKSPFITALQEGEWDLALVGFNLCIDCDPSPYLTPGGSCNFSGSGDARFAMLIDRMRTAETEEKLREAAYDFQAYFVENVPFVTLYFRLNSIIYSADIMGLDSAREPDLLSGIKDWYVFKQ